jgi:hypothetical protein
MLWFLGVSWFLFTVETEGTKPCLLIPSIVSSFLIGGLLESWVAVEGSYLMEGDNTDDEQFEPPSLAEYTVKSSKELNYFIGEEFVLVSGDYIGVFERHIEILMKDESDDEQRELLRCQNLIWRKLITYLKRDRDNMKKLLQNDVHSLKNIDFRAGKMAVSIEDGIWQIRRKFLSPEQNGIEMVL